MRHVSAQPRRDRHKLQQNPFSAHDFESGEAQDRLKYVIQDIK